MTTPIAPNTGPLPSTRLALEVLDEKCLLSYQDGNKQLSVLEFQIGIDTLAQQIFKHTPPRPIELEQAIDLVEEAIMQVQAQVPRGLAVDSRSARLLLLQRSGSPLQAMPGETPQLSLQQVESLFNRLADLSQGRPAMQDDLPTGPRFAAALLIWRELMHHLQIETVTLAAP